MQRIDAFESQKVALSKQVHSYLRQRDHNAKWDKIRFYVKSFLLLLALLALPTTFMFELITYFYPMSSLLYYSAYVLLCVISYVWFSSTKRRNDTEEKKQKSYDPRLLNRVPLSTRELSMLGVEESRIGPNMRDRRLVSILNQPQTVKKQEQQNTNTIVRRRGHLDKYDYDIINPQVPDVMMDTFGDSSFYDQASPQRLMDDSQFANSYVAGQSSRYFSPAYDTSSFLQQPQSSRVASFAAPQFDPFAVTPQRQFTSAQDKQIQDFNGVLSELQLTPFIMNRMVDNLKGWFVTQIMKPLLSQVDHLNSMCQKEGLDLFNCNYILDAMPTNDHMNGVGNIPPPIDRRPTIRHILTNIRNPQTHMLTHNRLNIEQYLLIRCNRKYLIQRIQELSSDLYMTKFVWNGGGDFRPEGATKAVKWVDREDLATDTAILLHLFKTWMDLSLPEDRMYGKHVFTNRYFINRGDVMGNQELSPSSITLINTKLYPPHFNVYGKTKEYEVPAERNNFFIAVSLFVFFIEKHNNGFLESIKIHEPPINLNIVPSDKV